MRMLLIVTCLATLAWPRPLANEHQAAGTHSAGGRIEKNPTAATRPVALMPLTIVLAPLHDTAEAAHVAVRKASLAAEPLTDVPIDDVCATLAAAADASGLPALFFLRLIWQESRFKQRAVSSAGALGVAQFMPEVAAERGLAHPFEPHSALWASAFFLREHYRSFGNLGLAAMAYNAGAQRVLDWLARRGKLPDETRKYVTIITGHPPEAWLETKPLTLALDMPRRAPCGDVARLSQRAGFMQIDVQLETPIRKIIATAKAEAAKAAAARTARAAKAARTKNTRQARAKASKSSKHKQAKANSKKNHDTVKEVRAAKSSPAPGGKRAAKKAAANTRAQRRERLVANE